MQINYDFFTAPLFDNVDLLQSNYEKKIRLTATESRKTYQKLLNTIGKEDALDQATRGIYDKFARESE